MIEQTDRIPELVKCDIDFHRALTAGTGSPRLRRLHESIIGEAHLCMVQVQVRQLLHPQIIAEEHTRILAMIEARDPEQARREMDNHISRARKKLVAFVQERLVTSAQG
jgi:DNA-binding GntR family transcriptional regulator